MATFRKSGINKQQKSSFINSNPPSETKFKGRSGIVIPNRVFVGGICPSATENDLLGLFAKYGSVKAVKIISDQNGSSKGYGFVTYEKADDVSRLQSDAKNLVFNDRRLNIAPAVMKNPPYMGRYPDSFMVPITPSNIYFTNNLPYQYQEGGSVFPSSPYAPPLTVLPTMSDPTYYQNSYSSSGNFVPTTPYQGAALFYPVPHNTSPIMVGPQPYNSSYQPVSVSNSNYVYSSPNIVASSPPSTSAKTSTVASSVTHTSEVHGSHPNQMVPPTPPNVNNVPPPLPYPVPHPSQFYNGNMAPPYSGDIYYNMVHGACYPLMPMNGHETYIPYYDVAETCSNNTASEESVYESQNYHGSAVSVQSYQEVNGKETSSPSINGEKQLAPQVVPASSNEHVSENYVENAIPNQVPQTPVHTQHPNTEYPPSIFLHRSMIYPNTSIPPGNMYYNSLYMADTNTPALTQTPYPKNLSEHYVSDHLPKRDSKYVQKKYPTSPQAKDNVANIPNIPKFPFYINNNLPGFFNRNVKEKDFKNGSAKVPENKPTQRPPRSNSNGNSGAPKPRVFHNQNQYGITRAQKNGLSVNSNGGQYARSSSAGSSRQSYEQPPMQQVRSYEPPNNYGQNYQKNGFHEKKPGQNINNAGYRSKYEKINGPLSSEAYSKNSAQEDRGRKYTQDEEVANAENTSTDQVIPVIACGNVQPTQQTQQLCGEMQNLTL